MKRLLSRAWRIGFTCLLLWANAAQSAPCQHNLPPSNPDLAYIDHGDGTVTDTRTGLMWKQCAEGLNGTGCASGAPQTLSWAAALQQAEGSSFAGRYDWRLPNLKELQSLVEDCSYSPAINTNMFPNTPSVFWSSSPSFEFSSGTWHVSFVSGTSAISNRFNSFSVRLVRGGQ